MTRSAPASSTVRLIAARVRIAAQVRLAAQVLLAATVLLLVGSPAPATAAPVRSPSSAVTLAAPGDEISWGVAPAQNALGSGRAHFDYSLDPAAKVSDALVVANHSDKPITLRIYASDAFTTHNGGIDVLAAGQKSVDVGAWVTVAGDTVTVAGGQTATVPFTLTVPANATPGDHSGGIVTSLVDDAAAGGVRVEHRLGSRMYVRVSGALKPALSVTDVHATYSGTINPTGSGDTRITYTVRNSGNVRLSAHQNLTVVAPMGLLTQTSTVADLPEILPGNSLTNTVTVSGVFPALRLGVNVNLTPIASDNLLQVAAVSGSTGVWALPWGQLIVLLVIAAVVFGFFVMRRRQQRAIAAAVAQALNASSAAPR